MLISESLDSVTARKIRFCFFQYHIYDKPVTYSNTSNNISDLKMDYKSNLLNHDSQVNAHNIENYRNKFFLGVKVV